MSLTPTHTPLRGVTFPKLQYHVDNHFHFNSHTPYGVWRYSRCNTMCSHQNFNSHTSYGEWRIYANAHFVPFQLVHPIKRCDKQKLHIKKLPSKISTRTPLTGCDMIIEMAQDIFRMFQFTHLMLSPYPNSVSDFNSHIPCGVWLSIFSCDDITSNISTHTPLTGCDISFIRIRWSWWISIHTSDKGRD